ncbi:3-deoxy-manno-octulosonate cytidylyltransferase [Halofilum ochraceum]|uniref:3-deoxy-manno-octulosonate cytidylyltransferase n=1 Tax=Halofilum ochraceum TaxID=1611323 RepID=UPI0008DAA7B8|nr:3-deoxy-manno-octulosonate cytidylyltransferase [Halofilum ochraceum]
MSTAFRVAIPARYASTRFPGKPLTPIAGRTMLEHVWRRACEAGAEEVVVATDDDRIAAAAEGFGATVCMTRSDHASGTDRLAEVAQAHGWSEEAIVVNLQGDEPLMPPVVLRQVAEDLAAFPDAALSTLSVPLVGADERHEPNVVKVVTDRFGYALYFSRAPIPYPRNPEGGDAHRHLGIYAYRAGFLRQFSGLDPAPIEQAEQLEQLRALWHGHRIHVTEAAAIPAAGVDAPGDVARVEAALQEANPDA